VEVVASLSQGRTAVAQCGLFTHKSVPVIFEPPCITMHGPLNVKVSDNIEINLLLHGALIFGIGSHFKFYIH